MSPSPPSRRATFIAHFCCALSLTVCAAHAEEFPDRIDGDIGLGRYATRRIIKGKSDSVSYLPYGEFDYQRIAMRLDTLSVKTLKIGYGYLEFAGRYSQDGFRADTQNLRGLNNRNASLPLGVGTLQITPIGAFFINAFHDVRAFNGNLFELIYAAEFGTDTLTFYPLAGGEYQSANYTRYYYGITAQEAANSQYAAYSPGGAFNPLFGMMVDVKLSEALHLDLYARRKWLDTSIKSSPIVGAATLDTNFIALSYRLK